MSSNIEVKKRCSWCGKEFIARKTTTEYCSHRCSNLAYKARKRNEKVKTFEKEYAYTLPTQMDAECVEFLTPTKAAKLLGICRASVYNYLKAGDITAVQFKGKTLIRRKDIDKLFDEPKPFLCNQKIEQTYKQLKFHLMYQHICTTVSLLRRPITNGRISLYLDFYPVIRNPETMKMTRREYLGIYIYAKPANDIERNFNRQMLEKAKAIRCLRVTSLINEKFDFLDHDKMHDDWERLADDFVQEFDMVNLSGRASAARTNLGGSQYVVALHRDSRSGIAHLNIAANRVDMEGK